MVGFSIGEYIRNAGYNIVSVLLLAVTFVVCTIFLSNISTQQRMNNFLKPYLNEDSIIIGTRGYDFDVTKMTKYEKSIMTREVSVMSEEMGELRTCLVYNDYSMEKLTPRLLEGELIGSNQSQDGVMQVLISENSMGVGVGDVIEVEFFNYYGEKVKMPAKVTGIVASGQKLLFGNGVMISKSMDTNDIFGTYSYEQLEYALLITTEDEFAKVPEKVVEMNNRCIVKFKDNITKEERDANFQMVISYEHEHGNIGTEVFPEMTKMVERQQKEIKAIMIKYVPLTVAVCVLIGGCIICMVSIKNANSMKYYACLYICGMPYQTASIMSAVEMTISCILGMIIAVTVIILQNKMVLFGEINCELGAGQVGIMAVICIVIILSTFFKTRKTLKERSPMNVLRDTAY